MIRKRCNQKEIPSPKTVAEKKNKLIVRYLYLAEAEGEVTAV